MTIPFLYQLLYWMWLISEAGIAIVTRTRAGNGKILDRGSLLLLWITLAVSITIAEWTRYLVHAPLPISLQASRLLSLFLIATGLIIRWSAIFTLGRYFSANVAIRNAQPLKDSGIYRYVRHPSYAGLLLVLSAIGFHAANWISLLTILGPCTAALLYRIHIEESALGQAFGGRYEAYQRSTKRLVPGIY